MNWDAIGAVGEIVGALAVFITLAYLAVQVKLTNGISKFNTAKDIMASFDNLNKMVISDPSLRAALNKKSDLTNDDNELLYTFANMWGNTWTNIQHAHDNGLVDEEFYRAGVRGVPLELQRWARFEGAFLLWLERYPEFKEYEIFSQVLDGA
ncbi:MAG: hypothetical protein V7746_15385 [Halioglobus sp.]